MQETLGAIVSFGPAISIPGASGRSGIVFQLRKQFVNRLPALLAYRPTRILLADRARTEERLDFRRSERRMIAIEVDLVALLHVRLESMASAVARRQRAEIQAGRDSV